jgi:hypothetical protein
MLVKADIKSAFRLLKVAPSNFDQLGFRFEGKYYFDKCLPMGASINCTIFEKFSTALPNRVIDASMPDGAKFRVYEVVLGIFGQV